MPVLQFKGKTAVENHHHTVPHHRLEFDAKLSLLAKGEKPSLDGNLIVEGDNLLALKALLPTHAGKVKCIYIDPPYNTGNEGWVYNDNLTQPQFKEWIGRTVGKDGEDACRHDKWCCMMYPRLTLLRELLADDGIILVSIDDNEVHYLRAMMDEIFGNGPAGEAESNFMGSVIWKTRNTDNRVKTNLSEDHEYVLVYRKTPSGAWNGRIIDRSDFQDHDDPRGPYVTDPLTGKATAANRPNLHFVITNPDTGDKFDPDPSRGWITDRAGMKALIADDRMWWPPDPNSGKPRKKRYLSETSERMPESSFWTDVRGQSGADEVDQLLGERLFDFPKLTDFLIRLIDVSCGPDALILDCTAGSGTTGHAVLALNNRDEGKRRFILVQQKHDSKEHEKNGLNICQQVTAQRIHKVIKGYAFDKPKRGGGGMERIKVDPLQGSFTYARVGDSLFGEYKDFGDVLPAFEDIAKYVFYTETNHEFPGTTKKHNSAWDKKSGRIGEHAGRSYYLLYVPNEREDRGLDRKFLKHIASQDSNRELIVYCERLAVHQDELRQFEREHGKKLRPMLVPFNLK
ncbi:MAG: site-specific DNA-methyltransferase [Pirellulaceae bacterium]